MLTNYYTLRYIASNLDSKLRGLEIGAVFSQEKKQLVLTFEHSSLTLILDCGSQTNTLYLHPGFARAKSNSANILLKCWGKNIRSIFVQPADRVVTFECSSGLFLQAQMFGTKANVLLVDSANTIVDSFKDSKTLCGTRYEPRRGELIYDVDLLEQALRSDTTRAVGSIVKNLFPTLGSTLVQEVLHRSDIAATTRAGDLDGSNFNQITSSMSTIFAELATPSPRIYVRQEGSGGLPVTFSLIKLQRLADLIEKPFHDVHEAIRYFVSRERTTNAFEEKRGGLLATLTQQLEKAQRTITALETDALEHSRADQYEYFGKLLLAQDVKIAKGSRVVHLTEENIPIQLEPQFSPVQNAQRYFEKAKKTRIARRESSDRLIGLRKRATVANQLLATLELVKTKEGLKTFVRENKDDLQLFRLGIASKKQDQLPFRLFTVDGGFEVWAGKSSANNDLLTMKHAKPNDLWFHVRGAGGSHVVLKVQTGKGEPGKRAREQAAGIAAYYSKMKNAKMVPVAMTERKYVRKPKGAPPGTVTIEREKVIFAEPALPKT